LLRSVVKSGKIARKLIKNRMDKQLTFFPDFLEWFENQDITWEPLSLDDVKFYSQEAIALLNKVFLQYSNKIWFDNFKEINLNFFEDYIDMVAFWNKKRVSNCIFYQQWWESDNNIFINSNTFQDILQRFWTKSWIIFIISHEFAHWIQSHFWNIRGNSCDIECHANYVAGYLIQLLTESEGLSIDIDEIMRLCNNHGTINDLRWVVHKKKKTHFNGLESKRSFQEGYIASQQDFLNTFPIFLGKLQVRPYQNRPTNYTWPDFYTF
jgi:hypothetical protein